MKRIFILGAAAVVMAAATMPGSVTRAEARGAFQAPDGKDIYREHCKQCHGAIGEPTKSAKAKYDSIPSFKSPGFFANRSVDSIVTVLKKGKGKDMKSWSEKLNDAEMKAVAEYIRTLGT